METMMRAAFDVGSAAIKMTVAEVDVTSGKLVAILFSEQSEVLLGNDFKQNHNNTLSDAILTEAKQVLSHYRATAHQLGATQMAGVATAVFRESDNGADFIAKAQRDLAINLHVIPQEQEGKLGFLTAVASAEKAPGEVIAWDSGGASFQISTQDQVYQGPWGNAKALAALIEDVQGKDFSRIQTPNPATIDELLKLTEHIKMHLPSSNKTLEELINDPAISIVAIGGPTSLFRIGEIATGSKLLTKESILAAMEELAGSTDEELAEFPQREIVLPKLALIYAVIDHFAMPQVLYTPTNGNTLGILLTSQFWSQTHV